MTTSYNDQIVINSGTGAFLFFPYRYSKQEQGVGGLDWLGLEARKLKPLVTLSRFKRFRAIKGWLVFVLLGWEVIGYDAKCWM